MKKIILKLVIFILLFLTSFVVASKILVRKGNGYGSDVITFYHERKNSLDLIFFGSSHSYATFIPSIIKEETNLNSYNFATQQQPLWISYYYMLESLKYQKPKYFVLEVLMTSVDDNYMDEGVNRDAIDKMRFSINKINAINESVENKSDRLSYYLNIIKYHSRWNELGKLDILSLLPNYHLKNNGYTYLPKGDVKVEKNNIKNYKETKELSKKNMKYLNKIIDLAKENNIELILVKSPVEITEEKQIYYNEVEKIAKDNNLNFINYNYLYDEINLDFENDFFDRGHLDGDGAEKVSRHFAYYLNNLN